MTTIPTISMSAPDITPAEIEAMTAVLQTPYLSMGPRIKQFEQEIATYAGEGSLIGVRAAVTPGQNIGDWSVIGAGSCVISNVPGRVTAVGVPAKIIKEHNI